MINLHSVGKNRIADAGAKSLLRPAQKSDIAGILEIESACFDIDTFEDESVYRSRLDQFADGCHLLIVDNRIIANFTAELWSIDSFTEDLLSDWPDHICCHHSNGRILYISSVAVHPLYQGQGYAMLLLRESISYLLKRYPQIDELALTVSVKWPNARQLYAALGFIERLTLPHFFQSSNDMHCDGLLLTAKREQLIGVSF